jgi:hypothetical protein
MAPRTQHTLADIDAELLNRLEQSPFWAQPERTAYINEGIRAWACLTGQWKQKVLITTIPLNPYYVLPGVITFGMHVEFNGGQLIQSSVNSWDKADYLWENRPGTPSEWAPIDLRVIAIRRPDIVGFNSIAIDGVSAAPILVNPTDYIDMSEDDYTAYIGYLQYLAAFKEGGAEHENSLILYQTFIKQAAIRNEKLLASAIFRRVMGLDNDDAGLRMRMTKPAAGTPIGAR